MSLKSWIKKYYRVPDTDREITEEKALELCILKWSGLSKAILKRHGLIQRKYGLYPAGHVVDQYFNIDGSTCHLCIEYERDDGCNRCPLYRYLGRRCDGYTMSGGFGVYGYFTELGDNKPMLKALRGALKMVRRKNRRILSGC